MCPSGLSAEALAKAGEAGDSTIARALARWGCGGKRGRGETLVGVRESEHLNLTILQSAIL